MQSEPSLGNDQESERGLPVVVPPSGKFIAQLFLVPFIIVASVVCFLLVINWLVGTGRNPQDLLNKLDSPNADVRWRAAEDLAQVLLRDDALASDPKFALDLTERLQQTLQNLATEEKVTKEKAGSTAVADALAFQKIPDTQGDYVLYLSACLGNISIPVGAPL